MSKRKKKRWPEELPAAHPCPGCGDLLECATAIGEKGTAGPGDFSICINCGNILRINKDYSYHLATPEELDEDLEPPKIALLQKARSMIVFRGPIPRHREPKTQPGTVSQTFEDVFSVLLEGGLCSLHSVRRGI